jgi:LysM repeat protein
MSLVVGLTPAISPLPAHATPAVVVSHTSSAPYGWQLLTVREGDTLSDIATTHRSTVGTLVARNRLSHGGSFLSIGQTLLVPRAATARAATARTVTARTGPHAPATAVATRTATYVVRSGDTLDGIAAHFKVSLKTLHSLNTLARTAFIQPGQRINVPATAARAKARAAASVAVSAMSIRVRSGDTLSAIALRQGVSLASLMKANRLSSGSILQIGQTLKVVTPVRKADSSNTFAGRTYSAKIVNAASANRAWLADHSAPSRTQIKAMVRSTAQRHGLDPRLALAISWQESGWNQRMVSVANAIGAMQVIPSSGVWASGLVGRKLNLLDAQDNITAGMVILRSLTRSAHSKEEAVAGYYQGLDSVQTHGMYPDTKVYVKSILALMRQM